MRLTSVVNPLLTRLLQCGAGRVLGRTLAVVTYVGRRTGEPHALVVQYRREDATVRVRVGRPQRKQWWRNFSTPRPMTLHLAGQDHAASAHVVQDGGTVTVVADLATPAGTAPTRSHAPGRSWTKASTTSSSRHGATPPAHQRSTR